MLQVRQVRVGDVKLRPIAYRELPNDPAEDVLLKAETQPTTQKQADGLRTWASVHMNLLVGDAPAPGKELLLAVTEKPLTEEFGAFVAGLATSHPSGQPCKGRVGIPNDGSYELSFTVLPEGSAFGRVKVRFHAKQAQEFVRALLYHWFVYKEEPPPCLVKESGPMLAATPDGVCEVKAEDGDPDDQFID